MQEVEDGISAMQQDNKESRLVYQLGLQKLHCVVVTEAPATTQKIIFSVIIVSRFAFFSKNKDMIFEI